MTKVPITRRGYERLYWQLQFLKRYARREVAADLAAARAEGLSIHNLSWRTAREKQAWTEARIQDLEEKLALCEVVISPLRARERVTFGLWVKVLCAQTGQDEIYQMVGPFESDVSAGRLSVESPVGQVLMGRKVGEWVTAMAPNGPRSYQVLQVSVFNDESLVSLAREEVG